MNSHRYFFCTIVSLLAGMALFSGCHGKSSEEGTRLLHVSYDPTREFFDAYNRLFLSRWRKRTQKPLTVVQSHGGSGKQARAVIEGLHADVVSLALSADIDQIAASQAIAADWQRRLPHDSSPFYSTVVFLVRRGNPRQIEDWADLSRPGIEVVMPNPKTSGGARWNYLGAWASALERAGGSEARAGELLRSLLNNVAVFDSGARGAATTFVERELGDVLVTWENDAWLVLESDRGSGYQIVYPQVSVRAEPAVSVVDRTVDERSTRDVATLYLEGLYQPDAQRLLLEYHFRPIDSELLKGQEKKFPALRMSRISDFGGWREFQQKHFSEGGLFDTLIGEHS